jgi:membrane associated rhomboid family serine protease
MAYTNRPSFSGSLGMGGITPAVKWLLIANTAIFILSYLSHGLADTLFTLFGLMPARVVHSLAVWQIVSYMFLHDATGFTHILFNMLALWMFGVPVESTWGTRRFLRYYFLCGIGAGVAVVLLNYAIGDPHSTTIGASGAIYGLLLAFGMLFPEARILFFFLFPIPAKIYVWIMAAIVFLSTLGATGGAVSHIAHLGGMVAGFVIIKTGLGMGSSATTRRARRFQPIADFQEWYRQWKLARARRKFQVYLRKHGSAPRDDRWTQ